jgi:hypothetical protein
MTFYSKLKWILGILLVFVLIVTTNLIDRNNFIRVKDSVVTIYEDRLIAKNIIYEISKAIQVKEMAALTGDTAFYSGRRGEVDKQLERLISRFEQTKLTSEESTTFKKLIANLGSLSQAEEAMVGAGFESKVEVLKHLAEIRQNLDDLSEIQISEGSRQLAISKRAIDTVELFTQLEIYLLVFLAIVIQIIVMYKPRDKSS